MIVGRSRGMLVVVIILWLCNLPLDVVWQIFFPTANSAISHTPIARWDAALQQRARWYKFYQRFFALTRWRWAERADLASCREGSDDGNAKACTPKERITSLNNTCRRPERQFEPRSWLPFSIHIERYTSVVPPVPGNILVVGSFLCRNDRHSPTLTRHSPFTPGIPCTARSVQRYCAKEHPD